MKFLNLLKELAKLSKSTLSHAFDASSNTGGPSHRNDALSGYWGQMAEPK